MADFPGQQPRSHEFGGHRRWRFSALRTVILLLLLLPGILSYTQPWSPRFAGEVQEQGRADQVQDLERIPLKCAGGVVRGRVVDSAGRPIAGVRVFNSGDAWRPVSARTNAQGRFRLEDLYPGPVYLFAQKSCFRFIGVRAASGGPDVSITLLGADEAPPPRPKQHVGEPFLAEQRKIARGLLERLWMLPLAQRAPSQRRLLECMTRLDPDQGLRWARQAGGRHLQMVRVTAAERLAGADPDKALTLLDQVDHYVAYLALRSLGKRYLKSSPAKALRFLEAGVVRAQALHQPDRTWALASLGNLLRQLDKDELGRKLIDEAAAAAATMGKNSRGLTATALAAYDLPRALELLEPITEPGTRARFLGDVAAAVSTHDLDNALEIAQEVEMSNSWRDLVRLRIACRVAPTQAARAIQIVESLNTQEAAKMKAEGFAWIAVGSAASDKKLAWSLIDRSVAVYEEHADAFRRWKSSGGRSVLAAHVFLQARDIGYPDLESLLYRVLALRPTSHDDSPARVTESLVTTAMVLALADPTTAKQLLHGVEARSGLPGNWPSTVARKMLMAWALADPMHASNLFERELAVLKKNPKTSLAYSGLVDAAEILTLPPPDRPNYLFRRFGGFWLTGKE